MINQKAIESAVRRVVQEAHAPTKIILFGSYTRGNADRGSDIDLLVVERDIHDPVEKEKLRALNAYAVQFRYEGCPIEALPSAECEAIATELAQWARSITGMTN